MNKEEIQSGVDAYKNWYHSITLPHGVITPGHEVSSDFRWDSIEPFLPSLKNKTVLDIGAWDGFYSFRAEQAGAEVLATDHVCWGGFGWGSKAGFDFAKLALKSNIKELEIDVPDISIETVGEHDLVFFLNVLYHLESPYTEFKKVASVSKKWIIMETIVDDRVEEKLPYFRFAPDKLLNDATNWFVPNDIAVRAMFNEFGFEVLASECTKRGDKLLTDEKLTRKLYLAKRGNSSWML
jgi:tRNA (mo5U34)-methyltransferase